jgi:tetratricopeptide (TPR) repeat protein/tRNA A-37 threonylcarbamoyl transferase component Bud32
MANLETDPDLRVAALLDEALTEFRATGALDIAAWQDRYPDLAAEMPARLETLRDLDTVLEGWKAPPPATETPSSSSELTSSRGASPSAAAEPLPERFGRYRILARLGAGGMGIVYKAEDPKLQRMVALKIPRFQDEPRDQTTGVQRFLREARAAAQVRHPHICPIHDVGEHQGLPYVVMAYVEGGSLAERLSHQGRYEDARRAVILVRQVAEALAELHEQGIIHRDLKPGNILIDAAGQALLTDFGLARLTHDVEHLTVEGALLGTLAYMAPEQASGQSDQVSAWTDLYSLGIVLYRILTGRLPFEGSAMTVLHQIANASPPPPSARRPDLDAGLDAIVQKAMARRPEDRYQTAREFVGALELWLAGIQPVTLTRPVSAAPVVGQQAETVVQSALPDGTSVTVTVRRPATASGQVRVAVGEPKRKKRNRPRRLLVSVTVALAVLCAVVLGHPTGTEPAVVLRESAPTPVARVIPVAGDGPRFAALGGNPDGVAPAPVEPADAVEIARQLKRMELEEALATCKKDWGDNHPATATSLNNLAFLLQAQGDYAAARPYFEKALAIRRQVLGEHHPDYAASLNNLAALCQDEGEYVQAESLYRQALAIQKQVRGEHHPTYAASLENLAALYRAQGEYAKAEPLYRQALALRRQVLGERHPACATSLNNLAALHRDQGDYAQAELQFRQALEITKEGLGERHADYATCLNNLAALYRDEGDYAKAELQFRQALDITKQVLGERHPTYAHSLNNLAQLYRDQGKYAEAKLLSRQALDIYKKAIGKGHPDHAQSLDQRGRLRGVQGDNAAAWPYREVLLCDARTGRGVLFLEGHSEPLTDVTFSPDGKYLASASVDRTVRLWDAATGRYTRCLKGHSKAVTRVVFSPDGRRLASAGSDGTVKLWDASTGSEALSLQGNTQSALSVVFSPDGRRLASAGQDKTVRIWDAATGQVILSLQGHTGPVSSVAYSADGRRLASASGDGTVKVWDTQTGQAILSLQGHARSVRSVAFSPDGKRLASASDDRTVKTWDVATGRETRTLKGHSGSVRSVAFSPDGKRLVTASSDEVRVWDTATGRDSLMARGRDITSVAFSLDGERLAIAADDAVFAPNMLGD